MSLPNIYSQEVAQQIIDRINQLTPNTQAQWGKMNVAQMLAHCNVTYELTYENIHPRPNFLMRFMLKSFVKKMVVNEKPYPKNNRTAPVFLVSNEQDFEKQKTRLIEYINRTVQLGASYFEGKENHGFGVMSSSEWNNMFYKHLDHHLSQFNV